MLTTFASPNQQIQPLSAAVNAKGHLTVGGCDVVDLAAQYGTPLYIIDEKTLRTAGEQYVEALTRYYPGPSQAIFASKAWSMLAICAIAHQSGLGIDVVSAGELFTALKAGVPASAIYFHGNNKSQEEVEFAIRSGVTVVADNWTDIDLLSALALDQPARVMVRVTPGIECHTHDYIRTGHLDSKFGFDPTQLPDVLTRLANTPNLRTVGLHAHIGSQIFELQPHVDTVEVLVEWFPKAQALGLTEFNELNIGGGLGIRYIESDDPPSIEAWVRAIAEALVSACQRTDMPLPKLLCEPGRSLVATACVTAYTIGATKIVPGVRTYACVDGGMSDNPRPITYGAQYSAVVANKMQETRRETVTIAGKHCESGDILLRDIALAPLERGDCLTVFSTGAYNCSMASNYNRLTRPAAVLVADGEATIVLKRESIDDLLRFDCLPERLKS
jgi:diaminopimelate decarboxylase